MPVSVPAKSLSAETERASEGGFLTAETEADSEGNILSVNTEIASEESIHVKYGNVSLSITSGEFSALGFEYADLVSVTFLDQTLILPVVPKYRYVASHCACVKMSDEKEKPVELAMFNSDFADSYGLSNAMTDAEGNVSRVVSEGVEFPITVTIRLEEKYGYEEEYAIYELEHSNERSDYPDLSDEEFANFRMVATTGIGKGKLYRSSSPICPEFGRNTYADNAAKAAGVKSFVNLANSEESAGAYEGYADSYYSKQDILFLHLGPDFSADYNREKMAEAMEFIADAQTPILIHCQEGQDRAGFVSAMLECLMGASFEEVRQDYMTSFYNYYGVKPHTDQYELIASNIERVLCEQFGLDSLEGADLKQEAEDYLKDLGVSGETIAAVREKLG